VLHGPTWPSCHATDPEHPSDEQSVLGTDRRRATSTDPLPTLQMLVTHGVRLQDGVSSCMKSL